MSLKDLVGVFLAGVGLGASAYALVSASRAQTSKGEARGDRHENEEDERGKHGERAAGNAERTSGSFIASIPMAVMTDSYKATHFLMYPEAQEMVAYGEFRTSFGKRDDDQRFVFFGIR